MAELEEQIIDHIDASRQGLLSAGKGGGGHPGINPVVAGEIEGKFCAAPIAATRGAIGRDQEDGALRQRVTPGPRLSAAEAEAAGLVVAACREQRHGIDRCGAWLIWRPSAPKHGNHLLDAAGAHQRADLRLDVAIGLRVGRKRPPDQPGQRGRG